MEEYPYDIVHPKDSSLKFPFVRETLEPPHIMIKNLFFEYYLNKQDYDYTNNILYRPYEEYYKIDAVSCHFTEHIRVQDRLNKKPTLVEIWKSLEPDFIRSFEDKANPIDELRIYMFSKYKAGECNYFSAGLCIRLYLGFNDSRKPVKILDPSGGWGCRMLTAIACGDLVSQYDCYDPREDLREPYQKIIDTLDFQKKCRFFIQPFETAEVPYGYYDLAVTSPPYFDLEVYGKGKDQSIAKGRNTYSLWLENFYYPYLKNTAFAVRSGGKIVIYISDYRDTNGKLIDLEKATLDILLKRVCGIKLVTKGEYRPQHRTDPTPKFARPFFVFEVI